MSIRFIWNASGQYCRLSKKLSLRRKPHIKREGRVSTQTPDLASFVKCESRVPTSGADLNSDADLSLSSVQLQTWTSHPTANADRVPISNANFINNTMRGSRSVPNVIVVLLFNTRTSGSRFNIKTQACVALLFNFNASLWASPSNTDVESVSSASQHQSEVRGLARTRVSAVTDSHELGQLYPIFSHIMRNNVPLWRYLRGWLHSSHYGEI